MSSHKYSHSSNLDLVLHSHSGHGSTRCTHERACWIWREEEEAAAELPPATAQLPNLIYDTISVEIEVISGLQQVNYGITINKIYHQTIIDDIYSGNKFFFNDDKYNAETEVEQHNSS